MALHPTKAAITAVVFCLALSGPATAPAHQDGSDARDAELARRLLASGDILPLEHFITRAREIRQGTVIDAELAYEAEHSAYIYEIRLLDSDGDVWELEFDAANGRLIEHDSDNH